MSVVDIEPEKAIQELLAHNVIAESGDTIDCVPCYIQGERPNVDVPDDFIEIYQNGNLQSITSPIGFMKGTIALSVFCKSNDDGTAKRNRVRKLLKRAENLVVNKSHGGYFFEISKQNMLTPPVVNFSSGYSMSMLNIQWHTTKNS